VIGLVNKHQNNLNLLVNVYYPISKLLNYYRMYFVKLHEFIVENQHVIYQAIKNKQELNMYS
jgi:hypothetical protein